MLRLLAVCTLLTVALSKAVDSDFDWKNILKEQGFSEEDIEGFAQVWSLDLLRYCHWICSGMVIGFSQVWSLDLLRYGHWICSGMVIGFAQGLA